MINKTSLPVVTTRDGHAVTTSRDIAAFFGKRHNDICRMIKKHPVRGIGDRVNYELMIWVSPERRAYWQYEMTRDGFMFVAASITGARNLDRLALYLEAFNQAEAALKSAAPSQFEAPTTVEQICAPDGGIPLWLAAHVFGVEESRLLKVLRYGRWIYLRAGGKKICANKEKVWAQLLTFGIADPDEITGKPVNDDQVLITPRGINRLADFFDLKMAA